MAKITLDTVLSGLASLTKHISNYTSIQTHLNDKVLYRDNPTGEANQMENALDMNSNRVNNLGAPTNSNDAARLKDVTGGTITVGRAIATNNAALKLIDVTTDQNVFVEGFTTAGDGGHGEYYWDSSSTETEIVGVIVKSTGVATGRWKLLYRDLINIKQMGAKCDGVTDDLAAFNAAESMGGVFFYIPSSVLLSADPSTAAATWILAPGVTVTVTASNWNPHRYIQETADKEYSRKVNALADNPSIPVEFYALLGGSYSYHDFWINAWGSQETDSLGGLAGHAINVNAGQTRNSRSGANQCYWQANHTGEGDAYNHYNSIAVTRHSRYGIVTEWGGQNSGGQLNGQSSALSDQVNLYGFGDIVLKDTTSGTTYDDVAMLGMVLICDREGADVAGYEIPRFNYMAQSGGSLDVDAAYIVKGNFFTGVDFSGASLSSAFAISMASGQRIGFDATAPVVGKFSTKTPGTYWIDKSGTTIRVVVNNSAACTFDQDQGTTFAQHANLKTLTTTDIEDITHAINTSASKREGSMIFNSTTNKPIFALGNADGDAWVDATGATVHTPV